MGAVAISISVITASTFLFLIKAIFNIYCGFYVCYLAYVSFVLGFLNVCTLIFDVAWIKINLKNYYGSGVLLLNSFWLF
jgi:hypothetical protein